MKYKILIAVTGLILVTVAVLSGVLQNNKSAAETGSDNLSASSSPNEALQDNRNSSEIIYYEGHQDNTVAYNPNGWIAGEGSELKQSQKHFLADEYKNAQYAYNAAYEYGLSSSGHFAIHDHYDLQTGRWLGYTIVIKE